MDNYNLWLEHVQSNASNLVLIEIGAGKAVPTVRRETENRANSFIENGMDGQVTVVRINPVSTDAAIDRKLDPAVQAISLVMNGEEALVKIGELIDAKKEKKN